ncbi:MAG: hypothetical protein IPJ13_19535 [Saprospiraceae bacterium]|nr:hypothetical protein [Saprospiraceae bacterium]
MMMMILSHPGNDNFLCELSRKHIQYHKASDTYISLLESKKDSISHFALLSKNSAGLTHNKYVPMPVLVKNAIFLKIDSDKNLYLLKKENQSIVQKINTTENVVWSNNIHPLKVFSVSENSPEEFLIIGKNNNDSTYFRKVLRPDGSLISDLTQIYLPKRKFKKIVNSGNTIVALDTFTQTLIFSENSKFKEKQFPNLLKINDIEVLENGNILAGGYFKGEIQIGQKAHYSPNFNNAILLTYDKAGNFLFSQSVTKQRDEFVEGVESNGNAEVAYFGSYEDVLYRDQTH